MIGNTGVLAIFRTQFIILNLFLVNSLLFSGCSTLQEAQQRREARLFEERNTKMLMLVPTDANIQIEPDALFGASDHYTVTFAEDLQMHKDFDEVTERREFAQSALGYMESLYAAMNEYFGFQPQHQIHVTFHDVYRGTRHAATTGTSYDRRYQGGRYLKVVTGIKMDYPIAMYEQHHVRAHELTHAFTNIYFLPVWFSEGLASLIQVEYAKGGSHQKLDLQHNLKLNLNGVNALEDWQGHTGDSPLTGGPMTRWRYNYSYSIVSKLREDYGDDFYIKVFQFMEADGLHQKLPGNMNTSFLVYYLSKAAGVDLVPFFKEWQFQVRKLEKADILKAIEAWNHPRHGGN